jgi:hypothetical protein
MKKILFLLSLLIISLQAICQTTISGKVIDAETNLPLPFVSLGIEDMSIGTLTNIDGKFEISIPKKSICLVFSSIAYKTEKICIAKNDTTKYYLVSLKNQAKELDVFVVTKKKAPKVEKLLKKVIANIPTNYPQKPYNAELFYREWLKDSTSYVRLVEAALQTYDNQGFSSNKNMSEIVTEVQQLRYSKDYSQLKANNFIVAIDFSTKNNWLRNGLIIFNPKNWEKVQFEHLGYTTQNDQLVHKVAFQTKLLGQYENLQGTMYVNDTDFAVLKIDFSYQIAFQSVNSVKIGDKDNVYTIKYSATETIVYKKFDSQYFTNYQNKLLTYSYYPNPRTFKKMTSQTYTEQLTSKIITNPITPIINSSSQKQIALLQYNADFWKNYNLLTDSPLETQIKNQLEEYEQLEKQFKK